MAFLGGFASPVDDRGGVQARSDRGGLGLNPLVSPAHQPVHVCAQLGIQCPAMLHGQTGRLLHDQGGPPLRQHPGLQGGQGVRHLVHQRPGHPQMGVPTHRRIMAGQRDLRGQPLASLGLRPSGGGVGGAPLVGPQRGRPSLRGGGGRLQSLELLHPGPQLRLTGRVIDIEQTFEHVVDATPGS